MSASSSDDWCLIESDPAVFTELLETLGCTNVELAEVWNLDDLHLQSSNSNTIYGLVFLFQWIQTNQREHARTKEPLDEANIPPHLFFAHQVTTNACATQAILSVVLNAQTLPQTDLGDKLFEFKSFTESFPPHLKGVAISSSDEIRNAHNSFRKPDLFMSDSPKSTDSSAGEAFHFVAYVPHDGVLYELDGLQRGPIVVGAMDEQESWLTLAKTAIQDRMTQGDGGAIKFNLMAIQQDARVSLRESLQVLETNSSEYAQLLAELEQHETKREQWKLENERRRHNYVPLCMQLFQELARKGSLMELAQEAKEREAERRATKVANKKM